MTLFNQLIVSNIHAESFDFRFAVAPEIMTLTPINPSVDTVVIGSQSRLSPNDIKSLAKAYSCAGRVTTNGGGNAQVGYLLYMHIVLAT